LHCITPLNKKKIINDPVYGFISVPTELVFDLIEHPYFQRLRYIKQVGMTHLVYPGALHTRFHHALGAMHLMCMALETLKNKGHKISDEEEEAVVIAILLHDIGHLLHDLPQDIADQGIDTEHESLGSAWLSQHFGPEVTEPVRMHVDAKRYLSAVEPGYYERLTEASILSLKLQGGVFDKEEAAAFADEPFAEDAVKLRRWDEEGKEVGLRTPALAHFYRYVEACLK